MSAKKRNSRLIVSDLSAIAGLLMFAYKLWQEAKAAEDFVQAIGNEIPTLLFAVLITVWAWLHFKDKLDNAHKELAGLRTLEQKEERYRKAKQRLSAILADMPLFDAQRHPEDMANQAHDWNEKCCAEIEAIFGEEAGRRLKNKPFKSSGADWKIVKEFLADRRTELEKMKSELKHEDILPGWNPEA